MQANTTNAAGMVGGAGTDGRGLVAGGGAATVGAGARVAGIAGATGRGCGADEASCREIAW